MSTRVLTKEDLVSFQKRFSYFHDSVVESWEINWIEDSKPRVKSRIRVINYGECVEKMENGDWCRVILTMENCDLLRFVDSPKHYYRVTSNGIHALMEQADKTLFGIDFGHFNDPPESILKLKESPCCVVCSQFSWEIL